MKILITTNWIAGYAKTEITLTIYTDMFIYLFVDHLFYVFDILIIWIVKNMRRPMYTGYMCLIMH